MKRAAILISLLAAGAAQADNRASFGVELSPSDFWGLNYSYYRPDNFGLGLALGNNTEAAPDVWDTYPSSYFWHYAKPENDITQGSYYSVGSNYTWEVDQNIRVALDFGGTLFQKRLYRGMHTPTGIWGHEGDYWKEPERTSEYGVYIGTTYMYKYLSVGTKYDSALGAVFGSVGFNW
ncbi:hypothetical protein J4N45_14490 [Vibrio sp. SCSIO 43140]|uniref:hypothetical protein n=1 Tax=Vibrio sp. SCSIO 43140 TaxID=2819100 RepID=UPI0020755A57|nr:hypothetical protein [Vibrio sp. SCSIO 43140]USD58803.1 hypothetical protein J4N45_09695 [Vibrio sp. SCSIO 43140]USD59137.1 hypothetical protein J4N45_11400 [Vibrio sp. SCSIO 43140]USD59710.1 hypothetical protein J4N45_14490 [Vibrio sp. SCSIO 43140]